MKEIESKYKIDSIADYERLLQAAGAEFLGAVVQTDRFYDTPKSKYRNSGCGLRLRQMDVLEPGVKTGDFRPRITFKGPIEPHAGVKIRTEHETAVDSAQAARAIMLAAGLEEVMIIQKRRRSYKLANCQVELDELPLLGQFLEIEGPDEDSVERIREQLAITSPHISDSYAHMLAMKCKELNIDASKVTFDNLPE